MFPRFALSIWSSSLTHLNYYFPIFSWLQISSQEEFPEQVEQDDKVEYLQVEEVAGVAARQHGNDAMRNNYYELSQLQQGD